MVIAIDFDGTCVTHEFPDVGEDIGAAPILRELVAAGHQLVLFTMRSNCSGNSGFSDECPTVNNGPFLDDAVAWFAANDIPLFGVQSNPTQNKWTTSPKAYAQLYIDDAALGAPLIHDFNRSYRPFLDWAKARVMLVRIGALTV